jgi:hypothetical protein
MLDDFEERTKKCPHERVQYCPLYVAGHVVGLSTCMVKWDFDGCDVDHGRADYGQLVAKLFRQDANMVAECALGEERAMAAEQRKRNMRAAGVH